MQQLTYWYLEAEGYYLDQNFFVKEIALLKGDRTQCWTYYINQHANATPTSAEYISQRNSLGITWSYGEQTLDEVMAIIKEKIGETDLIFVSEPITSLHLKQYLPKITFQPCEIGFQMIHCPSENCDLRHGNQCARRRVHEIRYADNLEL